MLLQSLTPISALLNLASIRKKEWRHGLENMFYTSVRGMILDTVCLGELASADIAQATPETTKMPAFSRDQLGSPSWANGLQLESTQRATFVPVSPSF